MTRSVAPQPDIDQAAQNLQAIEKKLEICIAETMSAGLSDTAALLQVARLDLLTKIHGISEDELEVLLCTVKLVSDDPVIMNPRPSAVKPGRKKPSDGSARHSARR